MNYLIFCNSFDKKKNYIDLKQMKYLIFCNSFDNKKIILIKNILII
jgi:hypothetical protein